MRPTYEAVAFSFIDEPLKSALADDPVDPATPSSEEAATAPATFGQGQRGQYGSRSAGGKSEQPSSVMNRNEPSAYRLANYTL